jgi:hypothetical protein
MNLKNISIVVGVLVLIGGLIWPQAVEAQWPKLKIDYVGRNITTNGDWQQNIPANTGDKLLLRAILSNTEPGTTIQDINIQVPLTSDEVFNQHLRFHLRAMNSGTLDTEVVVQTPWGEEISYIPGSARVIHKGSTRGITPDTSMANLTTQEVPITNIPYGEANAVTVTYEVVIGGLTNSTPTPTQTAVGGVAVSSAAAATQSAVANTNPQAGVTDSRWFSTLSWLVVGLSGIGIKSWAGKIKERSLV